MKPDHFTILGLILFGIAYAAPLERIPEHSQADTSSTAIVRKVRCADITTRKLVGWTAAHEREEHLLNEMTFKFATTLRCRGLVNGHFAEWTAEQAMIRRKK